MQDEQAAHFAIDTMTPITILVVLNLQIVRLKIEKKVGHKHAFQCQK